MTDTTLARRIRTAAHLTGTFTLRSGAVSSEYFDKYLFEADPALLRDITAAMVPLLPEGTQALCGLELGGVPLAVALSQHTGLPTRFVRRAAKEYGTRRLAEGGEIDGWRVTVVEDVVTSGGQVRASCAELRARGATVLGVVCVIDREAGGADALAADGLPFTPLLRASQLRATAQG